MVADRCVQAVDHAGRLDAVAARRREDARAPRARAQLRRQHRFDLQQRRLRDCARRSPPNARTKRVPTTRASSSSALNISGGMSEPLRST